MEPSVDIDACGSRSFRQLACRNSRAHFVAATECDIVLARLGDSLDRYLRPDRDTVVSAHRQTLERKSYLRLRPEIAQTKHVLRLADDAVSYGGCRNRWSNTFNDCSVKH